MLALRFALLLAHALHRRGRVQLAPGTADLVAKFCFDAPCARGAQCNKAPELVVKLSRPEVGEIAPSTDVRSFQQFLHSMRASLPRSQLES